MPLRKFAHHHDQMMELADTILHLAVDGTDDALQQLQTNRIALSRTVAEHCSAEIAHLPAQTRDQKIDATKVALVRKYHSELLLWRGALMECNASWPTRRIATAPSEFCKVFERLASALRERVRWEEEEFYPAIFGMKAARRT